MPVPLDRAVDELRKYQRGLQVMSGGLTVSGGEPLLQGRFVVRLCAAAKAMGVHTAIETNGMLGDRLSDADLDQIDLVLLGLKSWGAAHQDLTGKDMGPTLDFARRLAARKLPVWVRFVLVPGLTESEEIVRPIAKFAASLGNVHRVEVLPFHQMGRYKWGKAGTRLHTQRHEPSVSRPGRRDVRSVPGRRAPGILRTRSLGRQGEPLSAGRGCGSLLILFRAVVGRSPNS